MRLRGVIMSAELAENPPDSGRIELHLRLQGVGPGQPRRVVVPYEMLLADESLDPDAVAGHGFQAEADELDGRWVVTHLALAANRVLRPDPDE